MDSINGCKLLDSSLSSNILYGMGEAGRVYGEARRSLYGYGEEAFSRSLGVKTSYDAVKQAGGGVSGLLSKALKMSSAAFDSMTGVLSVFEGIHKDHTECNFSYSNTMTEILTSVAKVSSAAVVGAGVAGMVASSPLWLGTALTLGAGALAGYGMGKLIGGTKALFSGAS